MLLLIVILHFLIHLFGLDYGVTYGHYVAYNFWSGFGSDLEEFAIIGAFVGVYHKHNCHDASCWRIGRHVVDGTPWCNKHHAAARQAVTPARISDADQLMLAGIRNILLLLHGEDTDV